MQDHPAAPHLSPLPPAPPARWPPIAAWLVIVAVVVGIVVANEWQRGGGGPPSPEAERESEGILLVMTELQGRYLHGAGAALGGASGSQFVGQARNIFGRGSLGQRFRFVLFVWAMDGEETARAELARLESDIEWETEARRGTDRPFELTSDDRVLLRAVALVISEVSNGEREAARDLLERELGWFGVLAAGTGEAADPEAERRARSMSIRTFVVAIGGFLMLAVFCFVGLLLLVVMAMRIAAGAMPPALGATAPTNPSIYAETFACWLVLFLVMMGLGANALTFIGLPGLTAFAVAFFMSLAALFWPLLRGVSAPQMRADIGLHSGRGLFREFCCGLLGYVAGVPFLIGGGAITFLLMMLSGAFRDPVEGAVETRFPTDIGPAHPIVGQLAEPGIAIYLQLLLVASVAAPVVEEIMFRGVLYRHLRDGIGGPYRVLSLPISVLLSAFIFAVIHPQGWMGVPALMGLAIAFTLAREWRGSLIAPIVMHAVSNGLVMTLLALVVSR